MATGVPLPFAVASWKFSPPPRRPTDEVDHLAVPPTAADDVLKLSGGPYRTREQTGDTAMMFWNRARCGEGVHNFQPRYDRVWPVWFANVTKQTGDFAHYKETRYVQDVCVNCGAVVERTAKP